MTTYQTKRTGESTYDVYRSGERHPAAIVFKQTRGRYA